MKETPFWKPALDTLQQIAREPVPTVDELRLLQRQIQSAIEMVERGELIPMMEQERNKHTGRFGVGVFLVGDFVIKRRNYDP